MAILNRKPGRKQKKLSEVNPIFLLENNKVVFKDGRVAVGFAIQTAEMETWSASDYYSFNTALARFMTALPVDTTLQKTDCYYYASVKAIEDPREYFELGRVDIQL